MVVHPGNFGGGGDFCVYQTVATVFLYLMIMPPAIKLYDSSVSKYLQLLPYLFSYMMIFRVLR